MNWMLTAVLAAMWSMAHAQGPLQSKTFYGEGRCNGDDLLIILEGPWEKTPIDIVGTTITVLTWSPRLLAFSGSSYPQSTDLISPMLVGSGTATVMFPAGKAFRFPAPPVDARHIHVDLHVQCVRWFPVKGWLTIFYQRVER